LPFPHICPTHGCYIPTLVGLLPWVLTRCLDIHHTTVRSSPRSHVLLRFTFTHLWFTVHLTHRTPHTQFSVTHYCCTRLSPHGLHRLSPFCRLHSGLFRVSFSGGHVLLPVPSLPYFLPLPPLGLPHTVLISYTLLRYWLHTHRLVVPVIAFSLTFHGFSLRYAHFYLHVTYWLRTSLHVHTRTSRYVTLGSRLPISGRLHCLVTAFTALPRHFALLHTPVATTLPDSHAWFPYRTNFAFYLHHLPLRFGSRFSVLNTFGTSPFPYLRFSSTFPHHVYVNRIRVRGYGLHTWFYHRLPHFTYPRCRLPHTFLIPVWFSTRCYVPVTYTIWLPVTPRLAPRLFPVPSHVCPGRTHTASTHFTVLYVFPHISYVWFAFTFWFTFTVHTTLLVSSHIHYTRSHGLLNSHHSFRYTLR